MIETGSTAPYAPGPAVIDVITAYRNKPIPKPITAEVVQRIGVSKSLSLRTIQALRLLGLLDDGGNPTAAFDKLRRAGTDEYKDRLAEIVRGAYSEIFAYRDPTKDTAEQITDAFRAYEPHGMRARMARLFLALCVEAGIIDEAPPISRSGASGERSTPKKLPRPAPAPPQHQATTPAPNVSIGGQSSSSNPQGAHEWKPQGVAAEDHLVIRGLLQTLPPAGSIFPEQKRREWADAVLAAFALIYERGPEGSDDLRRA